MLAMIFFGQMTLITPNPLAPPPSTGQQLIDNAYGPMTNTILNEQHPQVQLQQQQQVPLLPNYNLLRSLIKDRYYQVQQDDPRFTFLRDILDRLQTAENQERNLLQSPYGYDYEMDPNDYLVNNNNKRSWDKMNGMWGKRAGNDNWNKFRGKWRKDSSHGILSFFSWNN